METSIKTRFRKENKTWKKVKNFFPQKKNNIHTHTVTQTLSKSEKVVNPQQQHEKEEKNCAE